MSFSSSVVCHRRHCPLSSSPLAARPPFGSVARRHSPLARVYMCVYRGSLVCNLSLNCAEHSDRWCLRVAWNHGFFLVSPVEAVLIVLPAAAEVATTAVAVAIAPARVLEESSSIIIETVFRYMRSRVALCSFAAAS